MRYKEIIGEQPTGERVWKATQQRHSAMRAYQGRMRSIHQKSPGPEVGEKQAEAREKYQAASTKADEAIRAAVRPRLPKP